MDFKNAKLTPESIAMAKKIKKAVGEETRIANAGRELLKACEKVIGVFMDEERTLQAKRIVLKDDAPMYARRCLEARNKARGMKS